MTPSFEQLPYANVVKRAISDVATGRHLDGPGWNALGIDADFLARAGRHALSDGDRETLQRDAVRSRMSMLMRGPGDPLVIAAVPPAMRSGLARRILEDRLAVTRMRRAFVDRGPPVRPLILRAIRQAGVDAAAACMIATAYRWRFEFPLAQGALVTAPLDADRNGEVAPGATLGEIRATVPLGAGVRLTTTTDMRIWLVVPPMPETVARALTGRTLGEVFTHRSLPAGAAITETMRIGDFNPDSQEADHLLILFASDETPRTWRGCDPDSFGPIGEDPGKA